MFGFGIAAALGAPLVMTIGLVLWDKHWKGSAFALNLFKCNLASCFFLIVVLIQQRNDLFPARVYTGETVGFMLLSAFIGILVGDWAWLQGLAMLGARRTILIDACKPFLAAFFGFVILDEELSWIAVIGMVITVVGVVLVSLTEHEEAQEPPSDKESKESSDSEGKEIVDEENDDCQATTKDAHDNAITSEPFEAPMKVDEKKPKNLRLGFFYAFSNVALDTYGAVLIKQYGTEMTVWEINLLRFGSSGVLMMIISSLLLLHNKLAAKKKATEAWYMLPKTERRDWYFIIGGVVLVTFFTPALSNYALFQIALGLALTLTSVGPLYSLVVSFWLQNIRIYRQEWAGSLLAVLGIALLAWKGTLPSDEES